MMGFCLYWRRLTCVVELWFEGMEHLDSKKEAANGQGFGNEAGAAGSRIIPARIGELEAGQVCVFPSVNRRNRPL